MASKPHQAKSFEEEHAEPDELKGCLGCCVMCCFGCLTCCGCRNVVCRKIIFFPPNPPFYKIADEKLLRIPPDLLPHSEVLTEQDTKLMSQAKLARDLDVRVVRLKTSRGSEVCGCYITHPKATDTILYSHGNATDVGMQSYAVETMVINCRVNVFFYDYTGYGWSAQQGQPSPAHVESDCEAAYEYLVETANVPPEKIILYGQSLGSVPSCILAQNHKVKGMVIHSGLASAIRVIKPSIKKSPWFDLFRNCETIKKARCPVFVIHGTVDIAVPFSNGRLLYDNAPMKIDPWWVSGANHNNIEMDFHREYYVRLIKAFEQFTDIQKKGGSGPNGAEYKVPVTKQPKTSL
uniref:Serine aminopeptidase S33 domain-containing protein n=1 Tax=Lotharella oceanica TaxID=641309 RepID=A0A7S2TIB2_9EUKA|mmetsp:Transcript_13178/g.25217  ORF Transcript_13178/g.25217 Transcript_13178/m.25217 type:complete len:349 (+) Transcript_13178:166-1212(+)|eukprot:CAMPEP_0170181548 /NCGR_PEP_ID=MMETSP0040_2-20121228/25399_1 /TAXON_ID=641309 /ORGANISM="Lotharella oceanica, Strain CCMP622" /LENGTH=348 /DNA_ID=CAMNT_0010426641 /DNA_START=116 /DNA_END=1165 /DNA_ORIENTATION=-